MTLFSVRFLPFIILSIRLACCSCFATVSAFTPSLGNYIVTSKAFVLATVHKVDSYHSRWAVQVKDVFWGEIVLGDLSVTLDRKGLEYVTSGDEVLLLLFPFRGEDIKWSGFGFPVVQDEIVMVSRLWREDMGSKPSDVNGTDYADVVLKSDFVSALMRLKLEFAEVTVSKESHALFEALKDKVDVAEVQIESKRDVLQNSPEDSSHE